jgi:anti-sigma-K factor RskA
VSSSPVCDEFVDLAAGVALDATDAEEARWVEEHAARCPTCAERLREFREVAAALAGLVFQTDPPAALKGRILETARKTQQATPRRGAVLAWRPRLRINPAWAAVAASLMLSVLSLAWVAALHSQVLQLQNASAAEQARDAQYEQVVQVLASDHLAVRSLSPAVQMNDADARAMVYLDPTSGTGMVMCRNMPTLANGHAYQVWFVRGSERVSGGMLWPDTFGNGYTVIDVPRDLQSFESIGLTDEPGGNNGKGSAWPTSPRVMGTVLN